MMFVNYLKNRNVGIFLTLIILNVMYCNPYMVSFHSLSIYSQSCIQQFSQNSWATKLMLSKYAKKEYTSPAVDDNIKKIVQQVCEKFLFLDRAVNSTLLCPIIAITSQSSKPTKETLEHTLSLLNYLVTQEEAALTYNARDMVLAVHRDASYLSKPQARS